MIYQGFDAGSLYGPVRGIRQVKYARHMNFINKQKAPSDAVWVVGVFLLVTHTLTSYAFTFGCGVLLGCPTEVLLFWFSSFGEARFRPTDATGTVVALVGKQARPLQEGCKMFFVRRTRE